MACAALARVSEDGRMATHEQLNCGAGGPQPSILRPHAFTAMLDKVLINRSNRATGPSGTCETLIFFVSAAAGSLTFYE